MKPLFFALSVLFTFAGQTAQKSAWQPSPGHTQVPIWPGAGPDAPPVPGPEEYVTTSTSVIAGRQVYAVQSVSRPTMTVYSPTGKNTGIAVVVFPGGGYQILAIDLEGARSVTG